MSGHEGGNLVRGFQRPFTLSCQFNSKRPIQFCIYSRCQDEFRRRNIICQFFPDANASNEIGGDLLVAQDEYVQSNIERPVIIEERDDCSMPQARGLLGNKNVIRVFKVCLVRQDWINLPVRRIHSWMLNSVEDRPKQAVLNDTEIAKLSPGFTFGMFTRMERWVNRATHRSSHEIWSDRPIDVLFIGTTDYSTPLGEHRRKVCEVLRSLRGLNVVTLPSRSLTPRNYFSLSHLAKVIVSPWGSGELCHRDFEAMLDESVVVKPQSNFIRTVGDVLRENKTYIPCDPHFLDLESVIRIALEGKVIDAAQREKNRDLILHWWKPEVIVDWWLNAVDINAFR